MQETLPFQGLKVIDCASFIAGPAAATLLGDFGADVVKIEPLGGDPYRQLMGKPGLPAAARNYPWDLDSRNKRSVALDLSQPAARDVLHQLIASADVFITNYPLPARRRLRIDHESVAGLNPRLVYASFTAYGEEGPDADKSGFDSTAYWGQSGLADVVKPDADSPPARSSIGMGDHPSAVSLFAAIVTALYQRKHTGVGGLAHTSLLANGLWANAVLVQATLEGVAVPPRPPRHRALSPLTNYYRCRDGRWLNLALLNEDRQWLPLMQTLGVSDAAQDVRFVDSASRAANAEALVQLLDQRFALRDFEDWRGSLAAVGITFGVVNTLGDVVGDPQMRASGALVPWSDGAGLTVSSPFGISGVAKRAAGSGPALGGHTVEVLRAAGYGPQEIQRLLAEKVVG